MRACEGVRARVRVRACSRCRCTPSFAHADQKVLSLCPSIPTHGQQVAPHALLAHASHSTQACPKHRVTLSEGSRHTAPVPPTLDGGQQVALHPNQLTPPTQHTTQARPKHWHPVWGRMPHSNSATHPR